MALLGIPCISAVWMGMQSATRRISQWTNRPREGELDVNETMKDLINQMLAIQADFSSTKEDYEKLREFFETYQDLMKTTNEENWELKAALDETKKALQDERAAFRSDLKELENENSALQMKLTQEELAQREMVAQDSFMGQVKISVNLAEENQGLMAALEQFKKSHQNETKLLKRTLDSMTVQMKEKESDLLQKLTQGELVQREMEAQMKELKKCLAEKEDILSSSEHEKEQLRDSFMGQVKISVNLAEENQGLMAALEQLKKSHQNETKLLKRTLDSMTVQMKEKESDLLQKLTQGELVQREMEAQMKELKKCLAEKEDILSSSEHEKEQLRDSFMGQVKISVNLAEENQGLMAALEQLKKSHQNETKLLKRTLDSMTVQMKEKESDLLQKVAQAELVQREMEIDLQSKINSLEMTIAELKESFEDRKTTMAKKITTLKGKRGEERATFQKEIDSLQAKLQFTTKLMEEKEHILQHKLAKEEARANEAQESFAQYRDELLRVMKNRQAFLKSEIAYQESERLLNNEKMKTESLHRKLARLIQILEQSPKAELPQQRKESPKAPKTPPETPQTSQAPPAGGNGFTMNQSSHWTMGDKETPAQEVSIVDEDLIKASPKDKMRDNEPGR
ncbi:hypothetical protein JZ751_022188 [Albula glossodonta]|uniref:Uncharacterized protein n=1 Tax=Albula glossodonta TaxID=121402 RepID=A0A8T2NHI5_9TELE|nr:hypothetical protein JZ751_022188 [Albula glossodonta]